MESKNLNLSPEIEFPPHPYDLAREALRKIIRGEEPTLVELQALEETEKKIIKKEGDSRKLTEEETQLKILLLEKNRKEDQEDIRALYR